MRVNSQISILLGINFGSFIICRLIDKNLKNFVKSERHPLVFKGFYIVLIIIMLTVGFFSKDEAKLWWMLTFGLLDMLLFDLIVFFCYYTFLNGDKLATEK